MSRSLRFDGESAVERCQHSVLNAWTSHAYPPNYDVDVVLTAAAAAAGEIAVASGNSRGIRA